MDIKIEAVDEKQASADEEAFKAARELPKAQQAWEELAFKKERAARMVAVSQDKLRIEAKRSREESKVLVALKTSEFQKDDFAKRAIAQALWEASIPPPALSQIDRVYRQIKEGMGEAAAGRAAASLGQKDFFDNRTVPPGFGSVKAGGFDLGTNETSGEYSKLAEFHEGMQGAEFMYADLTGADFHNSNLGGADFTGADLTNTNFEGAYLRSAKFDGAFLKNMRLTGADMGFTCISQWTPKQGTASGADDPVHKCGANPPDEKIAKERLKIYIENTKDKKDAWQAAERDASEIGAKYNDM